MTRGGLSLRFGSGRVEAARQPFPLDPLPLPQVARARSGDPVEAGLGRPIGSPSIDALFATARSVLIVVSDGTRATGSPRFLPALVRRISGATRADLAFVVASGIHRRPTDAEIEEILGPELSGRYEVLRHDPDDDAALVDLGSTSSGTPVRVHRAVASHDRLVLTGAVGFHYYAGFSGGRKAVVPGLASRETISRNHLRALTPEGARHPAARAGVLRGNPVHRDMAEGAALARPHLVVNSVLSDAGIERLFAGHWRRAHEAACRHLRATRVLRVEPRDLVVASAGGEPTDQNLIQAHKTFEAAVGPLRPGGVLILAARCREGAGHPDFLPWFRRGNERRVVEELRRSFQVYGQTALSWMRKAAAHRVILVSGLPPEVARELGVVPAADLDEAFRVAREWIRPGTPGWLMEHGSRFLVEPFERPSGA
jgi:nickel-dependent lactate racemase